jgi:hypothetical protein
MSNDHDAVARRTTAVLAILLLFTIGLMLTQWMGVRNFREQEYHDCIQRIVYDERSNDLRRTEAVRFRELGRLALKNGAITAEQQQDRMEAYEDLADKAEAAANAAVETDCESRK